MTILDKILIHKKHEVGERKARIPISALENKRIYERPCVSLKNRLLMDGQAGIIAEFKRRSPSAGVINDRFSSWEIAVSYERAGAAAVSVLTDTGFFGGTNDDLQLAREAVSIPLLRKDFIIDRYQVVEAKAYGADVVLLIAAALPPASLLDLASFAKSLGLEVLLEVHTKEELKESVSGDIDVVGVNNRNLSDFTVDINRSLELAADIPDGVVKISESGIKSPDDLIHLKDAGFNGALIGEGFMREANPGNACGAFIRAVEEHLSINPKR